LDKSIVSPFFKLTV